LAVILIYFRENVCNYFYPFLIQLTTYFQARACQYVCVTAAFSNLTVQGVKYK